MSDTVSLSDVTVDRDSSGKLAPETHHSPEVGGNVTVRPFSKVEKRQVMAKLFPSESEIEQLEEAESEDDVPEDMLLSPEEMADYFDEKVVDPNLSNHARAPDDGLDAEFVQVELTDNVDGGGDAAEGFLFAILEASNEEEIVTFLRRMRDGELTLDDLREIGIDPTDLNEEEMEDLGLDDEQIEQVHLEAAGDLEADDEAEADEGN